MDNILIKTENVTYTYEGEPALRGISLSFKHGEFAAILGHNGSGKSTFAKTLNALNIPGGGKVWVDGLDTSVEENIPKIRASVGMVFQNPDNQIVASIVEDDVAFGCENTGVDPAEIRGRVDDALEAVRMSAFKTHATHQLSGGQKQRVAIAGAIAARPKCIVLDESTAMLDPRGRAEVLEVAHRLNKEMGITIILITHHMREVIDADRVIVFTDGFVLADGTPQEVFVNTEILDEAGLGVPDTVRLCEELGLPLDALNIDDCAEQIIGAVNSGAMSVQSADEAEQPSDAVFDRYVLETTELKHLYSPDTPFETEALRGIDFKLPQGIFAGIIGHTGSGKSTFIQHLNGLLKPSSGRILLNAEDIWGGGKIMPGVRGKVGLVFQYPEYQLFEETCAKDIAFGPRNLKLSEAEIAERVTEAAKFVGLKPDLLDKSPFALSGGEKRRVAIAGVIAMRPDVLILDEPTAGLDPSGSEFILENLREYQLATGCTLVLVTHSMEEIAEYADIIYVFNDGNIEFSGAKETIFARSGRLREIGLDIPEVTQVILKLRELGLPVNPSVYTVKKAAEEIKRYVKC
ncbi:MAG: energy-coupling factor transporter ATPase [Oscillospiraceae bacterium]|jgi:energy-coupling factor transport system ATP-binding protein|nr:energy-coupling factor transporter ATPase [Oscillospiraceae bacterium]